MPKREQKPVSKVRHLVAGEVRDRTWDQINGVRSRRVREYTDSAEYQEHLSLLRQQNIDQGREDDNIEGLAREIMPFYFEDLVLGCKAEVAVNDNDFSTIECKGDSEVCADGGFAFGD